MLSRLSPYTRVKRLHKQVQARPDTEFQQALIRLTIVIGFYLYFSLGGLEHSPTIARQVHFLGIGLTLISLFLLVGAILEPGISVSRRSIGMLHDFSVATYMLAISNETGAPIVAIYLWVTLGNGFRYGSPYLFGSTVASAIGFMVVYQFNSFWQLHTPLWWGIWLTIVVVPLYASGLLKQLHHALKREKEANLAKSSFLANMSHELRTPLNGVIGVADLLAETKLDKEQKEFAQIIYASAQTLLALIDNVLDISRIEAGRINSTSEDFDLHRLVNGTTAMLDSQARSKGLVLATHIAPQTPFHLHGDARHLRQVLINLIGNAIKFTEQGRIDVYIRPIGQAHPQRLRFEVVDTGIGIPESAQAHIFDSFTQADPSVTRRFGGSGLGTTIAKQLVEALGGKIGLHSREGEGTTLWFELPFILQATQSTPAAPHFDKPMRVAILASSELSTRTQAVIRSWGAEPVSVDNTTRLAAELSAYLSGGTPLGAVVVERCVLPGDPAAFLCILRDDPSLSRLPVILIESDPLADMARDAQRVREGFASVLRTPLNPTLLFNAIHAVLSQPMPHNVVSLADRFHAQTEQAVRLRILVAEDNPINQRVICGLLEHAGHEVFLAHDGEEALALLESDDQDFHLAIIDMHMPHLSGPEVVQRWRFMEKGHLPIIILTADARAEAQEACKEAGADTFLTKPINSRELVDVIARLTDQPVSNPAPAHLACAPHLDELDESILDNLAQIGGHAFVQDLLVSFEEDSERSMRDIEHALTSQDYGQWQDQLHMLKGGASDVGATRLARVCGEAERIKPYEMTHIAVREKLAEVRFSLTQAQIALTAYMSRILRAESI